MAYGKQQLRKAGEALLNVDQMYADGIKSIYGIKDGETPRDQNGLLNAARAIGSGFLGGASIKDIQGDTVLSDRPGIRTMAQATNLGARYGVPLTAAGIGLVAAADALSTEQTPGTVMP